MAKDEYKQRKENHIRFLNAVFNLNLAMYQADTLRSALQKLFEKLLERWKHPVESSMSLPRPQLKPNPSLRERLLYLLDQLAFLTTTKYQSMHTTLTNAQPTAAKLVSKHVHNNHQPQAHHVVQQLLGPGLINQVAHHHQLIQGSNQGPFGPQPAGVHPLNVAHIRPKLKPKAEALVAKIKKKKMDLEHFQHVAELAMLHRHHDEVEKFHQHHGFADAMDQFYQQHLHPELLTGVSKSLAKDLHELHHGSEKLLQNVHDLKATVSDYAKNPNLLWGKADTPVPQPSYTPDLPSHQKH